MTFVVYESTRLGLLYDSLNGLSVGDALGAQFFMLGRSLDELIAGRPPAEPWEWTDDTHMACSVAAELRDHGRIGEDRLAALFADRCEAYRGYGAGAVVILHQIRDGVVVAAGGRWRPARSRSRRPTCRPGICSSTLPMDRLVMLSSSTTGPIRP